MSAYYILLQKERNLLMINRRYIQMQGCFWMLYCIAGSFISLYLQSQGLNNQKIGVITAIFGTISAILQPLLGALCDKSARITWKKMILLLALPFLLVCVFMLIVPGQLAAALFIGLLLLLGNAILPFMNGAMAYYQQRNIFVNYGIARGIGSGMFALTAMVVGRLAERYGSKMVPVTGSLITILFVIFVLRMPCDKQTDSNTTISNRNSQGFIKRYPAFVLMTIAFIVLSTSHNIIGTYLLQLIQSLGGGSTQFGNALALQAIVEVPMLFCFTFLLKILPAKKWMLVSALGYGLKAICYVIAQNIFQIYLVQFTQMLNMALFFSASVYYTMDVIKEDEQVTGQAFMTSIMAAGTVLGSLLGGWIIDIFGMRTMLHTNVLISFIGIIIAFLSHYILEKQQKGTMA